MKKIDLLIISLIFFIVILSRVPLIEKFQSHWDGPQYSIAVINYSLEQETPAPPGYPLYIAIGKLFNIYFSDPHLSLLAISVLANAVGAIVFYYFGKKIYNRIVGVIASIIYLTGSTFYYFGLTAYAYGLLPLTTTLIAFIVYKIYVKKHKNLGLYLGIFTALSFGVRPQEIIQIGILSLLGFVFLSNKEKIKSFITFSVLTLLWALPFLYFVGYDSYLKLARLSASGAFFNHTIVENLELMLKGFLLSFGISAIFLIYYALKISRRNFIKYQRQIIFYLIWILPGIIFNLFIRTEHAGYQMSYLSGFLILISLAIWKITQKRTYLLVTLILLIAIFNLYWFFYDRDPNFIKPYRPTSFHYSDIRKNDLKVGSKVNFIKKNFNPNNTLLISTDVLWRPYMYHLRNYKLVALAGLDTENPSFKYNRFDAYNWKRVNKINKKMTVEVGKDIKNIVFLDDNASRWLHEEPSEIYYLNGNSIITSLQVEHGSTLIYGYHRIEVIE